MGMPMCTQSKRTPECTCDPCTCDPCMCGTKSKKTPECVCNPCTCDPCQCGVKEKKSSCGSSKNKKSGGCCGSKNKDESTAIDELDKEILDSRKKLCFLKSKKLLNNLRKRLQTWKKN